MEQPQLYRQWASPPTLALCWTGTNHQAARAFIGERGMLTPDGDGQWWFAAADLQIKMVVGWWFVNVPTRSTTGHQTLTIIPQDQFSDLYVAV